MAITLVSSSEQITSAQITATFTFTFDIGTRTNGGLVVGYQLLDTGAHTATVATWNAATMTKVSEIAGTVAGGLEVETVQGFHYLAAPNNGSNIFSITFSGSFAGAASTLLLWPAWMDGFKQTSPLDDSDQAQGTTDPNIQLQPTEDGTICFAMYYSDAAAILTSTQGTVLQTNDYGPRTGAIKYIIQTTAANQDLGWTGVDDDYLISAANFKAAAAAGGAAGPLVAGKLVGHGALLGRLVN